MIKNIFIFFSILILLLQLGCSSYQADAGGARNAVARGDYNAAAAALEKKAGEEGKDQLLYLLDYALMLHYAGRYKESNQAFLKADKMMEIKDYTSLSQEAGAILMNDNLKAYKGEDFEKILVNVYLAVNYTLMGEFEDARVECRRVNEKLYKYKYEAKRNYEQNPFARYLSATIWEADDRLDDAYLDYKFTQEIKPDYGYIGRDLLTFSRLLGRSDDVKKWVGEYGDLKTPSKKEMRGTGEVVLIFEQGNGPVKKPNPQSPRFPKFYPRYSSTRCVALEVMAPAAQVAAATTESPLIAREVAPPFYSIQDIAIKTLDDAYAAMVAKKTVGIVAKAVVADQVRQKNELLGLITWVGLNLADQADLRHWSMLPESLQIARLRLAPGTYGIKAEGLLSSGSSSGEKHEFQNVIVKAGKKTFLNWRSLN
jgi:hypothetical protein